MSCYPRTSPPARVNTSLSQVFSVLKIAIGGCGSGFFSSSGTGCPHYFRLAADQEIAHSPYILYSPSTITGNDSLIVNLLAVWEYFVLHNSVKYTR